MNAAERFDHWATVRAGLLEALALLSDEQLDFVPAERLWSLGKVARHIAEAEEGWFRYVVLGELAAWPEFRDEDTPTVAEVRSLLNRVHERTERYLETLAEEELAQAVHTPWGTDLSLRWIVWHVLEHEIHHRGEIFLMLGLMGMVAPEI